MWKKNLCHVVIAVAFFTTAISAAEDDPAEQLRQKQSLISSINLLNGLHLSGEQVQALLDVNLKAGAMRQEYFAANAERIAQATRLYEELLDSFSQDRPAPEETERFAQQIKHELEDSERAYNERLAELGDEIEGKLTDGQLKIISEFKPCLIPPRDLREPSRAGQASTGSMGVRVLEEYRKIMHRAAEIEKNMQATGTSRRKYPGRFPNTRSYNHNPKSAARERFTERFFSRYFEILEHLNGELEPKEMSAERKRVLAIFDRAAGMSEEDFSLNADELGAGLTRKIEDYEAEFKEAIEILAGRRGQPGRTAHFLVRADLIPVLEARVAQYSDVR